MSDATSVLSVTTRKPSIQESQEDKDPTKRADFLLCSRIRQADREVIGKRSVMDLGNV